ncbi:MAG: trypsin-like serine protease [Bdellovibrionales bacterium]|nr:trypsin-like serine protease [Bdellovibrionales bacterium]
MVRCRVALSLCIFASLSLSVVKAEAPSIPDGPEGTVFQCVEAEDDIGCYGYLEDGDGFEVTFAYARRYLRRALRITRRSIRRSRRRGFFEDLSTYQSQLDQYKLVKAGVTSCYRYDDPYCGDSGSGGGGGGGNENLGGNRSLSEACDALGGPVSADRFGNGSVVHRIINGAECSPVGAPTIKILYRGLQHCSGTLVKSNKVVTAGHCVQVRCSDLTVDDGSGNEVGISSCTAHPSYNSNTLSYDVAVLTLSQSLSNETIPVKTTGAPEVGATIALAGYGRNLSELGENIDSEALLATFAIVTDVDTQGITFQYSSSNSSYGNTCNGDSGGPTVEDVNGTWMLVGATSNGYAENCGMTEGSDTSVQSNLTSSWAQSFLSQQGCL